MADSWWYNQRVKHQISGKTGIVRGEDRSRLFVVWDDGSGEAWVFKLDIILV